MPAQGPVPGDPKEILDRADRLADKRDGKGCLAALAEIHDIPADMTGRAQEIRGDCEMLAGHCEEGRKILQPLYDAERRFTPTTAAGILGARVSRMCPISSFPTVEKRVLAMSLQARAAYDSEQNQSHWCSQLEHALLADTKSAEVKACFVDDRRGKEGLPCTLLMTDLANAYEFLANCFLQDKNCSEGARLDVMHTQVEFRNIRPDNPRSDLFCRPTRVLEHYTNCRAAGEAAQRKCMDRVDAARPNNDRLTPQMP